MPPARSTPVISQDTSPLLAAARARSASSSKKKKVAATEKENVGAEPPAARRKRSGPTRQGAEDEQPTLSLEEIVNQLTAAQAALEKERAVSMDLQKKLDDTTDTSAAPKKNERTVVPRPAGTKWNIQQEMGLAKTLKGHKAYKALIRQIHDITLQSRINWEVPWSQVPSKEKAMLFDVARERNPILKRYQNDWATEALVKQYVKNKRRHGYSQGWLEVPEKYAYLKVNSSKRSNAPRTKKVQGAIDAAKKRAAVARGKRRVVNDESEEDGDEGEDDKGEEEEEEEEEIDSE